jgi:hypothetical protein
MKNYLKGFNEMFQINEMASSLSKLGVPKKLIKVIHNLPDKIEKIKPFTFKSGSERKAELPPIGGNRPSHEVGVINHFRMRKTELLGNNYGTGSGKLPGYLADLEKVPWGDMRILLAVPEPGGKYAGQAPRYDYIYHKASAWGKKEQGGGKKYRILTMDQDGRILRDWQAYQGDLTYPRNPSDPDAEIRKRNDFKNFPAAADGMIDVYILDPEIVDYETSFQDMGGREVPVSHRVGIGKARAEARSRTGLKLITSETFIQDFADSFSNILNNIFGKRKNSAAQKYAELILRDDAPRDEIARLSRIIHSNQDVMDNIKTFYKQYLQYLNQNGDYLPSNISEIGTGMNISSLDMYASINDVVKKQGKMKALRNLAEFILTGNVNDIYKEKEFNVDAPEAELSDDFENLLDFDFDLENPFGDENL